VCYISTSFDCELIEQRSWLCILREVLHHPRRLLSRSTWLSHSPCRGSSHWQGYLNLRSLDFRNCSHEARRHFISTSLLRWHMRVSNIAFHTLLPSTNHDLLQTRQEHQMRLRLLFPIRQLRHHPRALLRRLPTRLRHRLHRPRRRGQLAIRPRPRRHRPDRRRPILLRSRQQALLDLGHSRPDIPQIHRHCTQVQARRRHGMEPRRRQL
jgi:hypothetical protein